MRRTRLSLVYVAGSLLASGAGLALAPRTTLDLLGASSVYDDAMPRALGIAQLALGAGVAEVVRHRAESLYASVAAVAGAAAVALVVLSVASGERFFLVAAGVTALGALLSAAALRSDRRPGPFARLGRQRDSMEMR